jgi:hypothetical protein
LSPTGAAAGRAADIADEGTVFPARFTFHAHLAPQKQAF